MTNVVNLKKLAEYTEEKIQFLPGRDLMELLEEMDYQIKCRDGCEQDWILTGYCKDREPGVRKCQEEQKACEKVRGLILRRIREELEPFGMDSDAVCLADDLDETGWDRELHCRCIQELLTQCYWFGINPLPALRKRHSDYRWACYELSKSEDATVPTKLAQLVASSDFVFAANGYSPDFNEYVFAIENPRTRQPRRIFSGTLKDEDTIKEAQKLLRQWKLKFVQLQEGER